MSVDPTMIHLYFYINLNSVYIQESGSIVCHKLPGTENSPPLLLHLHIATPRWSIYSLSSSDLTAAASIHTYEADSCAE